MLSQTAEHALRAVLYLAQHGGDGVVPAREVARALGAPPNYLSKTLHLLTKAGIVSGTPGRKGGYRLIHPPEELALSRVIEAFDGFRRNEVCLLGGRPCDASHPCEAHGTWTAILRETRAPLQERTVADLLRAPSGNGGAVGV